MIRPLLVLVVTGLVFVIGFSLGYQRGFTRVEAVVAAAVETETSSLAAQLTAAEAALAVVGEVEHDRAVCGRLGVNPSYISPNFSSPRAGADVPVPAHSLPTTSLGATHA
ncbi:hypothetical protein AB0B94_30360 [Micromonospora sp. NPDC048986]|uniref:hypothetical protein n=1 Tax=Micromonospora sp. NPDC048986 TaxID=3155644 RepID=UPI0033C41D98